MNVLKSAVTPSRSVARPSITGDKRWKLGPAAEAAQVGQALDSLAAAVETLPRPSSPEWQTFAEQVGRDLHPESGQGWTLLETSPWLKPEVGEELFEAFPTPGQAMFTGGWYTGPSNAPLELRQLPPGAEVATKHLESWLGGLFRQALPNVEQTRTSVGNLRFCAKELPNDRACQQFSSFHVDGGDIAALVALLGRGTDHLPNTPKMMNNHEPQGLWAPLQTRDDFHSTPLGDILLISGTGRGTKHPTVVPTVHRTPELDQASPEDRALLVLRLETSSD